LGWSRTLGDDGEEAMECERDEEEEEEEEERERASGEGWGWPVDGLG
jgi:hypothetical protein